MSPGSGIARLWVLPTAVMVVVAAPYALAASATTFRTASLFFLSLAVLAGLHVVTGMTRVVSLCHAALVGVGAYAAALVSMRVSDVAGLSLVAGTTLSGVLAVGVAALTRRLDDHYLAMATLALGEILANVFRGATWLTGGVNGLIGVPPLGALGVVLDTPQRYYAVCAFVGAGSLTFVLWLDRSLLGRALRAVGDEGMLVESVGLSAATLRIIGFGVGGMLAGLSGAVSAHVDGFVGPESFGVGLSIGYLCFLMLGGLGTVRGVLIGAAVASVGVEALRAFVHWQMILVGVLALVVLCFGNDVRRLLGYRAGQAGVGA